MIAHPLSLSFLQLIKRYFLSTYCVPASVLGPSRVEHVQNVDSTLKGLLSTEWNKNIGCQQQALIYVKS